MPIDWPDLLCEWLFRFIWRAFCSVLFSIAASSSGDPSQKRIALLQEEKDAKDRQIADLTRQLTQAQATLTTEQERSRGNQAYHSESEAKHRQTEQELARVRQELSRAQNASSHADGETKRELCMRPRLIECCIDFIYLFSRLIWIVLVLVSHDQRICKMRRRTMSVN